MAGDVSGSRAGVSLGGALVAGVVGETSAGKESLVAGALVWLVSLSLVSGICRFNRSSSVGSVDVVGAVGVDICGAGAADEGVGAGSAVPPVVAPGEPRMGSLVTGVMGMESM